MYYLRDREDRIHEDCLCTKYREGQYIIIWLTDFACWDWSIPGP